MWYIIVARQPSPLGDIEFYYEGSAKWSSAKAFAKRFNNIVLANDRLYRMRRQHPDNKTWQLAKVEAL